MVIGVELERSILDLPHLVESDLSREEKGVFYRIYEIRLSEAPMDYDYPEAMEYVAKRFNIPPEEIFRRRSLRVKDRVLGTGALFNPVRAGRPIQVNSGNQLEELRANNPEENCDFSLENLRKRTPKDSFGRIESEHCITAANPGNYYARHSLVIPKYIHDPTELTEEVIADMIHTGVEWIQQTHKDNPEANYPMMILNLLPRAGASVFHPHLQVMLAEGEPDAKVEYLRDRMAYYQFLNGFPYPDELAYCLRPLGLVHDVGSAHIIHDLTPVKEKGVTIYTNDGNPMPNGDLSRAIYWVLDWQRRDYNVTSLNIGIYLRPVKFYSYEEERLWYNFPPYARTVDRGSEDAKTADIGAMELFYSPVIQADQLKLASSLAEYLREKAAA